MTKLEEIDAKITELRSQLDKLYKERKKSEFEGHNYEGKFIYCKDWGYMYVTCQFMSGDDVVLQGLSFSFEKSNEYRDSAYFSFDASDDYTIPLRLFTEKDRITEIPKEEFMLKYRTSSANMCAFGTSWINEVEKSYNETKAQKP